MDFTGNYTVFRLSDLETEVVFSPPFLSRLSGMIYSFPLGGRLGRG
jgi:hypothetical protein